jgi:tetratricopeptide (TPR) repeat protein
MKRRLNLKYLACLLGVLVVASGGVHLVRAFQLKRNAAFFLAKSKQAEEDDHDDQAALEHLSRYLAYVPDDLEAWARFGLLLEIRARTPKAHAQVFEILEEVLRRQPDRDEVRRRLVDVAMGLGRFADARAHLDVLLQTTPDQPELLFQRGQCFRAMGDFKKAGGDFGW